MATLRETLTDAVAEFAADLEAAVPTVLTALLFLVLAYLTIKVVTALVRRTLTRIYPPEQRLVADFGTLVVGVAMWFAAALALLKVLGMGDIAASLGTTTGFVALGVSYALSDMIADTVAGLYLLRDPDFNPGDTVTAGDTTGTVVDIGLRKSRLDLADGDRVIIANQKVESGWTRRMD
ncbi:mechanosensitive ion channel family protein [Halobacteriales archaeon Cl-PHB]